MFSAIGRYFKAFGYLITGRIDEARRALETDPNVIRATYDEILAEKKGKIQEFMSAVATLIRLQEQKKGEKNRLEQEVEQHQRVKAGTEAALRKRSTLLQSQGKTAEEILADPEVAKHNAARKDVASKIASKLKRIEVLGGTIIQAQAQIDKHRINLERLQREIGDLKSEAADAVARVISAKEEKELADMLSGLSANDTTGERLASIREAVGQTEAEARVASELAGTDAALNEAQYLAEAESADADEELKQLLGLAEQVETGAAAAPPIKEVGELS